MPTQNLPSGTLVKQPSAPRLGGMRLFSGQPAEHQNLAPGTLVKQPSAPRLGGMRLFPGQPAKYTQDIAPGTLVKQPSTPPIGGMKLFSDLEVKDALSIASQTVKETANMLRQGLHPLTTVRRPKLLTPKQQVQRFLSMNHEDLMTLKARHGEESFARYVAKMLQLANEVR